MKKTGIKILLIVLIFALLVPSVFIATGSTCDDIEGVALEYDTKKTDSITSTHVRHKFTAKYTGLHKIAISQANKLSFDEDFFTTGDSEIYKKYVNSSNNCLVYYLRLMEGTTYNFRVNPSSNGKKVKYNIKVYTVQDSINSKKITSSSTKGPSYENKKVIQDGEKIYKSFAWTNTVPGWTTSDLVSHTETDFRFYLNRNDLFSIYCLLAYTPSNLVNAATNYWKACKNKDNKAKSNAEAALKRAIENYTIEEAYADMVGFTCDAAKAALTASGYKMLALLVPIAEKILEGLGGNLSDKTRAEKIYDVIDAHADIVRIRDRVTIISGLCLILKSKYSWFVSPNLTQNPANKPLAYVISKPQVGYEYWDDTYASGGSELKGAKGQQGEFKLLSSSSGINEVLAWATASSNTGFIDRILTTMIGGEVKNVIAL